MGRLVVLLISVVILMGASPKKLKFMRNYGCTYWKHMRKAYGPDIADIILTQAALESGYGTAKWVRARKQLTGTYDLPSVYKKRVSAGRPIDKLRIFKSFKKYYAYKACYYKRKGYDCTSVDSFIKGLVNYAEDRKYIKKITGMYKNITYLRRTVCTDH